MSNDLKIDLSSIETTEFVQNPQSYISQLIESSLVNIRAYIIGNLANLDGGPSITQLEITSLKYNSDIQKGSFRLKFQIERQYCCSDIQACANDYLDFDFQIEDKKLVAHTEYFDWSLTN